MNHFEYDQQMEMPTPCQQCGETFDLNNGRASDKWYPNTVICERCWQNEKLEIQDDEELDDLKNQYFEAVFSLNESLKGLKKFRLVQYMKAEQYGSYVNASGSMTFEEWEADGRYDPCALRIINGLA